MIASEFKHLRKEQLKRRVKILNVLIYVAAAIGITSLIVFFITDISALRVRVSGPAILQAAGNAAPGAPGEFYRQSL